MAIHCEQRWRRAVWGGESLTEAQRAYKYGYRLLQPGLGTKMWRLRTSTFAKTTAILRLSTRQPSSWVINSTSTFYQDFTRNGPCCHCLQDSPLNSTSTFDHKLGAPVIFSDFLLSNKDPHQKLTFLSQASRSQQWRPVENLSLVIRTLTRLQR